MKKQVKEEKKVAGKKRSSAYLKMFTVVVFGAARTGKSSLIKTFLGETFTDEYERQWRAGGSTQKDSWVL